MAGAQRETEPEELIGQDHVACQVHFLRGVETHLNVKQRADLRDLNFEFDRSVFHGEDFHTASVLNMCVCMMGFQKYRSDYLK